MAAVSIAGDDNYATGDKESGGLVFNVRATLADHHVTIS
jgi:hypothetical protein